MNEYALLINDVFQGIRSFEERPEDIPHKNVAWYPVVREYGTPFEGLEGGNWVIRTVDPATVPPQTITPRQCRVALLQKGMLADVEQMISQQDEATRITWEYALEFRRDDQLLIQLAASLGLTPEQIDEFFIEASKI